MIGLFVLTFLYAVYKGIPAAFALARETLDQVNAEHTHQIRILTEAFQKAVTDQHDDQKKYHEEHGKALAVVKEKIESCETFLKKPKNGRV